MLYCKKCCHLSESERCPSCGNKKMTPVQPDDICFLVEKEMMWAEMLADVLTQSEIPFLEKSSVGAGITALVGVTLEYYRFYVPYTFLEKAKEVVAELFTESDEDTQDDLITE